MLNIAHNNIASIAALNACHALQSLDASENVLQQIEDLSNLKSLKVYNYDCFSFFTNDLYVGFIFSI